jgi:tRNA G10  N-methylase Trm11
MYSIQGDTVLDPFTGTGTTMLAAMATARNFKGYEIDPAMEPIIDQRTKGIRELANSMATERLERHKEQMGLAADGGAKQYMSECYKFPVTTAQETKLALPLVESIRKTATGRYRVKHSFSK